MINVVWLISLINCVTHQILRNHFSIDFLDLTIQYEASAHISVHSAKGQQCELCIWIWKTLWHYTVDLNNSNSVFCMLVDFQASNPKISDIGDKQVSQKSVTDSPPEGLALSLQNKT